MWVIFGLSVPKLFQNIEHKHIPLIEIKPVAFDEVNAISLANSSSHLLFTSKEALKNFKPVLKRISKKKVVICVGPQTLALAKTLYKGKFLLPTSYDQEGVIELLKKTPISSLVYPRAKKVRSLIFDYAKKANLPLHDIVCYETKIKNQILELDKQIEGYFLSSSSCVEAFLKQKIDLDSASILVQGEITKQTFLKYFPQYNQVRVLSEKTRFEKGMLVDDN